MTRSDRILIAVIAAITLAAWPLGAVASSSGSDVLTVSGPAGTASVPLGSSQRLVVEGARGPVVVEIVEGAACVVEADCPDHICERSGRISAPGAVIACVPNGVVLRVGGDRDGGLDARVR